LVIGLGTSIKNRIGQASPFDKFILFGPLLFAIAMAVVGADHFVTASFVAKIVPSWIPRHVFWAYLTGAIFLGCALGLLSRKYARFAATLLGITVLALVLFAYLPLTITKASDVANGLNYLAIHFALAGAAFFLAGALPAAISEPAAVLEIQRSSVRQPSGS
jgi:uncharacterized membrane protein